MRAWLLPLVVMLSACGPVELAPCEVRDVDFKVIDLDAPAARKLTVVNPTGHRAAFDFGAVDAPFSLEPARFTLEPDGAQDVTARFTPTREGSFETSVLLQPSSQCLPVHARLIGRALSSSLSVDVRSIDFGTLAPGERATRTLHVTNAAGAKVIEGIVSSLPEVEVAASLEVPAMGGAELNLTFTASSAAPIGGTLTIPLNHRGDAALVTLSANHPGSCLRPLDSLAFPDVQASCTSPESTLELQNVCPWPLQLSQLEAQGPFRVSSAPTSIPAAGTASIGVRFHPEATGAQTGSLRFTVSDGMVPEQKLVPLRATGSTAAIGVTTLTVPLPAPVDLVLVIDASDALEHANVVTNLEALRTWLVANTVSGVTAHVGVLAASFDAPSYGVFARTAAQRPWIDPGAESIVPPAGASRGASCIGALQRASSNGELEGFFRPGSARSVLCITGQQDAFEGSAAEAVSQVLAGLGRGAGGLPARVSALAHFSEASTAGCGAGVSRDDGRISQLVTLTNGLRDEVCQRTWANPLERLGASALGYQLDFWLDGIPALSRGALQVFVDGVEVPSTDAVTGATRWSYDSAKNAVVFDAAFAPQPGQEVRVEYPIACP